MFVANGSAFTTELEARLDPGAVQVVREDTDFGGASLGPQVRVRTGTIDELRVVLEAACRWRLPVAIRGAGHSSGGHTSGAPGVVVEHAPTADQADIGDGFAEVPAHWTWSRVESALRAIGRDLVVATSSLSTTVGGTLSVGGFGIRSVRWGPQVDQVRALRLIGVTGEAVWCSPSDDGDRFHSALTGLGQVGIIERVRIATRDRHDHLASVTCEHESFSDLADYLLSLTESPARLDYCAALAKQGRLESFVASCHRVEPEARWQLEGLPTWRRAVCRRAVVSVEQFESGERAMPLEFWSSCRNLWCDYCLDARAFPSFAAFVDAELSESLRGHLGYVMSIAPRRGVPLALDMRPPSEGQLYSVGLFYSVPRDDAAGVRRAMECHALALDACVALGGRPYLYGVWGGAGGLAAAQLRSIYGSAYERLLRVRRHVDPLGLLNPSALNHD